MNSTTTGEMPDGSEGYVAVRFADIPDDSFRTTNTIVEEEMSEGIVPEAAPFPKESYNPFRTVNTTAAVDLTEEDFDATDIAVKFADIPDDPFRTVPVQERSIVLIGGVGAGNENYT